MFDEKLMTYENILKQANDRLDAMRKGVEYKFEAKIRDRVVILRPLTADEFLSCNREVNRKMNLLPPDARNITKESLERAREMLKLASTSSPGKNDWQITDTDLLPMTLEETGFAYEEYVKTIDKCNPSLSFMKQEDVHDLIEEIKKKHEKVPVGSTLIELTFYQLASIAAYLISKTDTSQTDK